MSKRKCGCIYATSANTSAVRSGHSMGGYLKEECESCKALRTAPEPASPKIVYQKVYGGDDICDLHRDMDEVFDERFNPGVIGLPTDENHFHKGSFKLTIEWTKE